MYISSTPSSSLKQAFNVKRYENFEVFPLNDHRCSLFYTARYALHAGVRALGLSPEQKVLIPSYNCGVEIDPVKLQELQIKYYRVKKDFCVDLTDLKKSIDEKTKAILITHYLGFPQPLDDIIKICKQHNIFLIEDCAHAFLSEHNGKPLGSSGDISIFSFRKTIPTPDGAVLVINNNSISFEHLTTKPNAFSTYYVLSEYLTKRPLEHKSVYDVIHLSFFLTRCFLRLFHKIVRDKALYLVYPSVYQYWKGIERWGISPVTKRIINSTNFEEIKRIRRQNFTFFLSYFRDERRFSLPIKELPDGVCPMIFPIFIEKRELFHTLLKKRGIATHDWWKYFHPDVPWGAFSEAKYLKRHLFGFPIHQNLKLHHLQKIVEEFETVYKQILAL